MSARSPNSRKGGEEQQGSRCALPPPWPPHRPHRYPFKEAGEGHAVRSIPPAESQQALQEAGPLPPSKSSHLATSQGLHFVKTVQHSPNRKLGIVVRRHKGLIAWELWSFKPPARLSLNPPAGDLGKTFNGWPRERPFTEMLEIRNSSTA